MIRPGSPLLENLHGAVGVHRRVLYHVIEMGRVKKMRARAGDEKAAAREKFHRAQIYFLVAAVRLVDHLRALGERRRVQDDHVEFAAVFLVCLQEIKHVRGNRLHRLSSPVERDIRFNRRDSLF